ncbi:MAG: HAD-IC family P-type ATPase [Coriobacteriales bacterium]|jgi:Cd2+/Zn2+-exporting ATPase|nr:HAD-IC family P-type ATPase [Coriobacteriales bacterium]
MSNSNEVICGCGHCQPQGQGFIQNSSLSQGQGQGLSQGQDSSQGHEGQASCCSPGSTESSDDDEPACGCSHDNAEGEDEDNDAIKLPVLIVCAVLALAGTALHLFGGEAFPFVSPLVPSLVSGVACALGLYLILPRVKESVLRRRVDISILMLVAVIGACLLGDFSEAGVVVALFCFGEWLEGFAIGRNRRSIAKLLELTPPKVEVLREGVGLELRPEEVAAGETIMVKPGSRIPLDGVITQGSSRIDEAAITGESVPVEKDVGAPVYSGSMNVSDFLEIKTTATVEDSTLARIVELVRESQAKRSPYERFINRFARYYTPLVLASAVLVALVPPLISLSGLAALGGLDVWVYRALSMMVVACPCALVIATPVSVVCALARAARSGILVKGGAFLELGAKVQAIAFDKTGTLTLGAGLNRNELRDALRPEAPTVMDELARLGIGHTVMLSGDRREVVEEIAADAHLSEYHAELMPEDKLELLRALKQEYGTVAMVGDGINDAPALALADVGIAMGALGTDTAVEAADVALMEDSLAGLPRLFRLSRKMVSTIRATVVFVLVVKIAVLGLTIAGITGMWMAILADTGVLIAVLLYSMRLLRMRL